VLSSHACPVNNGAGQERLQDVATNREHGTID
jgi:hypothetical protein